MAALPKHLSPDRMIRLAMTEFRQTPKLLTADKFSLLGAVIKCSQLGLEPGGALGHVYLIPFENKKKGITEVQVIPGYRGLIELARRSGVFSSINVRLVHERDFFRWICGDDEKIEHIPVLEGDPGKIVAVYAIVHLKDGGVQREVMTRDQVEAIRGRSRSQNVWDDHFDEMARKTVIRRIMKLVPLTPEIQHALDHEIEVDRVYPVSDQYALSPSEREAELIAFDRAIEKLGEGAAEKILGRAVPTARASLSDSDIIRLSEAINVEERGGPDV